jgi:hypothetical protein
MSLGAFEKEVLGCVVADYEAVHTIRGDIERDLGRGVSVEEVSTALISLVGASLIDAFVFDAQSCSYRRVDINKAPTTDLWFLANAEGKSKA